MKFKLFLLFVFVSICSLLNSFTWEIKQDGTGNFNTIQGGIIASTDSDTILVYPGTYYENIDYLEKSLTVASLYIITPEDSLINQTIIDGNQQFRCVTIDDCTSASLIGFTIQNGVAIQSEVFESYQGGGIYVNSVINMYVSKCKIVNNIAYSGGGLYIIHANAELSGNIISKNRGIRYAGGLCFTGNNTTVQFNETNLNSIFLNYSATGSDIYIGYSIQGVVDIIADTLTVYEPDYFFIGPPPQCTISQSNAKIEEIDQDLYVNPDGDDENSGLTADDPMQTLAWAQTLIKRNDENPNTIHLADGTYSTSLNNQIFPLNIKKGITFKGISPDNTIFDAESEYPFFYQFSPPQEEFSTLILEDIKLINGKCLDETHSGGILIYQADLHLTNVIIENCNGDWAGSIQLGNGFCDLNNVIIRDNYGQCAVSFVTIDNCSNPVSDKSVINSIIKDNHPNIFDPDFSGGGAFKVSGHYNIPGEYYAEFINCEISGNRNASYDPYTGLGGTSVMYVDDFINVNIMNCTIVDNVLDYNTGCSIEVDNNSEVNIYNTIFYNNDGYSFNLMQDVDVNISNSLIEGGDDNVNYYYPLAIVNWMEGNLNEDPFWTGTGDFPYFLQSESPCIDAGTLDLPAGIELPEFDLAGNSRIYGGTIDMGAYEWQGIGTFNNELPIINTQITNYPNPFNPYTTIKLDLAEPGKIELIIYNFKGQKVKTLLDAYSSQGHFEIIWRGVDDNKKSVASGNYFIKLKVNGKEKAVSKCILLK